MKYTRITAVSLAIATMTLAGCTSDAAKTDSTALKNDSALAASLALANADSAAKVSLGDTATAGKTKAPPVTRARPATKAPAKTAAAPTKTTPATTGGGAGTTSRMGTISAGTTVTLASNSKICTNTNAIGDNVTAETTEAISGTNGAAIPAGATVNMTVTNLKRSDNVNDKIVMEFRVNSVSWGGKTYPVEASVADADVTRIRDAKSKDAQKVVIGAAAGAIAGKILGKSTKATVIGGAAGAAAGAATAVATANYQGCINQGARITVRLDAPLQIVVGL